eukprot:Tbor_TRINITY_DN3723_c0_g1::TRINITY_DN3723_c0_g1_i1::g.2374::m.2374
MRRSLFGLKRFNPLSAVLTSVSTHKISLDADDLYRICMVVGANDDRLGLKGETEFLQALLRVYSSLPKGSIPPFQANMIDGALKGVKLIPSTDFNITPQSSTESSTSADTGSSENNELVFSHDGQYGEGNEDLQNTPSADPTIKERLDAIWECVELANTNSYTTGDAHKVQNHCKALDPMIRKLTVVEIVSLTRALATVNYYDLEFSTVIARRCCDLAPKMNGHQLCQTYFNLTKLNVQDSHVAIVRQIGEKDNLQWRDIFLFAQALERQSNTSAAPMTVVPKLAQRSIEVLKDVKGTAFHRAMLVAMSRYNCHRHPAALQLLKEAAKLSDNMHERDLIPILQMVVSMKQFRADGVSGLFTRANEIVNKMDIRYLDSLMDIVSLCPMDSTKFMNSVMNRLSTDAGKLTIAQLVFIIDLISSFPPVRGSPCAAALAFTANVKKDSIDGEKCELLMIALARMGHFTDDFFAITDFALTRRQGFRSIGSLSEFMEYLTPQVMKENFDSMVEVLSKGVERLAQVINDDEMMALKRLAGKAGIYDKEALQKIFGHIRRAQQHHFGDGGGSGNDRHHSGGGRPYQQRNKKRSQRNTYDPVDDLL